MADNKRITNAEDTRTVQEPTTKNKSTGEESGVLQVEKEIDDKDEQREQPLRGYEDVPKWMDHNQKRPPLHFGCEITTETNKYRIFKRLGAGGFGDVYSVRRASDGALFALKSEFHHRDNMMQRLKREVLFYEVVNATRREDPMAALCVLWMVDRGHNEWFKYIVMPYSGKSLDLIRERILKHDFQQHTAIKICCLTHTALKNMHAMCYIHRDVKLDNFVVGKEHFRSQIFLMDFGMATNYTVVAKEEGCSKEKKLDKRKRGEDKKATAEENMKRVPSGYGFIGTDKYASRSVHEGYVTHRKDDMESWLYLCMDSFGADYVPWEGIDSKDRIFFLKQKFFAGEFDEQLKPCFPKQIFNLRTLIDQVKEGAEPKYEEHERELVSMLREYNVKLTAPWEWAEEVADRMDENDWNDEGLEKARKESRN